MIEVVVEIVRVSLMSQYRVVILKDPNRDLYLTIWIGPFESEAITVALNNNLPASRPLTHDLLQATIEQMHGTLKYVFINDLRGDVFYAKLVIEVGDAEVEVDCRPSDAIALAVRAKCPLYVDAEVLELAGQRPDENIESIMLNQDTSTTELRKSDSPEAESGNISAFTDFLNTLNLDDLDSSNE
ncbi:bifunctional nuclease family protein [Anaerolineales bacterium]